MKRIFFAAALCLGSLTASAIAQTPAQDPAAPAQHRHMHHDPHKQTMHLRKKLGLSADQTSRLEPILSERRDQARAIRQNTALTPEQRKSQMHDLKRSTHQQMAGVLTPDQMQQLKSMHRQHQRQGSMQPAPTPNNL